MLGWHISAYRFGNPELRGARRDLETMRGLLGARTDSDEIPEKNDDKQRLAVWQTWLGGTDWLDALTSVGLAAKTSRSGYPDSYLLKFGELRERLDRGLLKPGVQWRSGPGDTFLPGYLGTDTAFPDVIEAADPEEWVVVVAWDES
jgi:hypothetical protein